MMAPLLVTIDGPAASGKSTVARLLADRIDATFLDTGAMYRAVTWAAQRDGVDLNDEARLARVIDDHTFEFESTVEQLRALVDGTDVTDQLRNPDLTASVRYVAASPAMRARLVEMQRQFARAHERVVTEGRDQGTVAFPDAELKFYLEADPAERARRRQRQLQAQGSPSDIEQLRMAIEDRDRSDRDRSVGPLRPAPDAILVDTTELTIEDVVERLLDHVRDRQKRSDLNHD
jgi:cytidylate kinase